MNYFLCIIHQHLAVMLKYYLPLLKSLLHHPLGLNASHILVGIVESRGELLSYAVLKKFHGSTW